MDVFNYVLEAYSEDVDVFEGSIQKEEDFDIVGVFLEDTIIIPFIKSLSV